jgi:toxin ParE1/3/4
VAEVRHSAGARADLKRIWRFIALDNEAAADKLLLRLEHRISMLADFPQSAPPRDDIRPGFRMLVFVGCRIIYEHTATTDAVEIVAVVEPYRDLDNLF